MYDENLRYYIQTTNREWDSDTDGMLTANIYEIRTPETAGETTNFIIYNYDKVNKLVLGRTYSNLKIASLEF